MMTVTTGWASGSLRALSRAALLSLGLLTACAGLPEEEEVAIASLAAPLDIPFTLDRHRIVVEAAVNGQPGHAFLFDTGLTDIHLVTPGTAKGLELDWQGGAVAYDSAGRPFPMGKALLDSLSIGPVTLRGQKVAVIDLPPQALARNDGTMLAGVLGDSLLHSFDVLLDFDRGALRLNPVLPPPGPDTLVLPLAWSDNLLTTTVLVAGQPLSLMIDTGDFGAVTLFEDSAARIGARPLAGPMGVIPVMGAAGPYMLRRTELPGLNLAGREVGPVEAAIGPRGEGMPRVLDGRLGLGLLSSYQVVIEAGRGRLLLMPRDTALSLATAAMPAAMPVAAAE